MAFSAAARSSWPDDPGFYTANDRFKAGYADTLRRALLGALILYSLIFLFSPEYVPTPYQLPVETTKLMEFMVDTVLEEIPALPEEVTRPPHAIPWDETDPLWVEAQIDVVETPLPFDEPMPAPPRPGRPPIASPVFGQQVLPTVLRQATPHYSEMARELELEGTVLVDVLVGPEGNVLDASIREGVHATLDRAALDAARRCVFRPAEQSGQRVPAWVTVPYTFILR